ncbi:MAG: hypothetical protein HQM10_16575 [Candidatus Riflebacteria bacterium]|nr:hypothetical protein [Candidatus Riflebacteria bacterium]
MNHFGGLGICGSEKPKKDCGEFELVHKESFEIDHTDKIELRGNFPVRVLGGSILVFLKNIIENHLEKVQHELDSLKNQGKMNFIANKERVQIVAEIDKNGISIYENYCQFLWSLPYSLISINDECFKKPMLNKSFKGQLERNVFFHKGIYSFNFGVNLTKAFSLFPSFVLPNPLKYDIVDQYYIEKANSIFSSGMAFSILHELGHLYYCHLDAQKMLKQHEHDADEYALSMILAAPLDKVHLESYKYGALISLLSIIFIDDSLSGGEEHPHPIDRIRFLLEQMKLDDQNDLWGMAALGFALWGQYYRKDYGFPKEMETFKELFEYIGKRVDDHLVYGNL